MPRFTQVARQRVCAGSETTGLTLRAERSACICCVLVGGAHFHRARTVTATSTGAICRIIDGVGEREFGNTIGAVYVGIDLAYWTQTGDISVGVAEHGTLTSDTLARLGSRAFTVRSTLSHQVACVVEL